MTDKSTLPAGYRQGFVTAISVFLTASLLYFRWVTFEPASGPWSRAGAVCAVLAGLSICFQLLALWRGLQPEDDQVSIYKVTLRWFGAGVVLLVVSFVVNVLAE